MSICRLETPAIMINAIKVALTTEAGAPVKNIKKIKPAAVRIDLALILNLPRRIRKTRTIYPT